MEKIRQLATKLFYSADSDENSELDYDETKRLLKAINPGITQEEYCNLFYLITDSSDKLINYAEFEQLIYIISLADVSNFYEMFYYSLDSNMDGVVQLSELKVSKEKLQKYMPAYQVDSFVKSLAHFDSITSEVFLRELNSYLEDGKDLE